MEKIKTLANATGKFISKNSPTILTGMGIAGMFSSVAMSIKATTKAVQLLEDAKIDLDKDELTGKEIVRTVAPVYWPVLAVLAGSTVCMIFANSVNLRRNAALATAYRLSETAFKDYQNQIIEEIGESKEKTIRDKVAQKHVETDKPVESTIIMTGNGDYLCRDEVSGRYFRSNIEKIRQAVNSFNKQFITDGVMCLNDFYDALDLPHIEIGYSVGWVLERMSDLLDIIYTTGMAEVDGRQEPCLILSYKVEPTYDFRDY